eukprot:TRINITY_DN30309_c0_g2_i1.p1 TRINITY_DN30309_c0_g2~~TRINITY_DN30309_c0_g2_i1.p1  ORF type:complete len:990 (-),score=244.01 TRINITY_DN30309_c0_g2_i1:83-3052(-)
MPPKRSSSLPALHPFAKPQQLVTVEVQKRRITTEAVKTGRVKKPVAGRLPFVAFERGIEWERPHVMAMLPPVDLPPLKKILKSIINGEIRGLDMSTEANSSALSTAELGKSSAFGGFPCYRGGPRLPMPQSKGKVVTKVEMERVASQPSESPLSSPPSKQKSSKASSKARTISKDKEQPATAETQVHSESSSEEDSSGDDSSEESDSDFGSSDGEGSKKATKHDEQAQATVPGRHKRASVAEMAFMDLVGSAKEEDGEVKDEFDLPFPWTEEELRATFGRFDTDSDGEIQTEDLDTILNYMGCAAISGERDEKIKDMMRYATINWEEFNDFLRKYRELDVKRLKAEFMHADADGNGYLDTEELHGLLISMGYSATKHTLMEALEALQCNDGIIRFKRFEKLREYLRKTEGISKSDIDELRSLYDRVCETAVVQARAKKKGPDMAKRDIRKELDIESEMPAEDIWRITMYLGYSADKQTVERLCAQVDADGSGFISFQELLKLIRRLRDGEFVEIGKVFKRYADDGMLLHLENLGLALGDLGYCVSEDAVFCILDELGELHHDLQMTREELAMFLRVYRRMEGFTPEEVDEIRTAFDEQCHIVRERAKLLQTPDEPGSPKTPKTPKALKTPTSPAGSQDAKFFENGQWNTPAIDDALDALRSSRVMRAFGFARSMHQVQGMLDLIDLDGSGKLEFNEFLKLMHRLFREEAMRRMKIFNSLDTKRNGHVPVLKLTTAIKMLVGAEPSAELAEEAAQRAGLSLTDSKSAVSRSTFEVFFKHYRTLGVQEIRENACYSLAEVQLLRETFLKHDVDGSGTVERKELARLITEYFPEATKSKEAQREVQLAIKDVDVNHDGVLDFREFLALMRRFDDTRDESDINLEKSVVEDLKYEPEEVEGYRQIFLSHANLVGELSLEMFSDILLRVVDLSPDEQEELAGLVLKVNPDGRQVVRFPHFLRLIKIITEENYGRVNQSSARILRKATKSSTGSQ